MSAFIQTKNSEFLVLTEFYNNFIILVPIHAIATINEHVKGGSIIRGKFCLSRKSKNDAFRVKEPPEVIAKMLSEGKR